FYPDFIGQMETIFALSNGVLGLRGAHEEDDPALREHAYRGFFVNGFVGYEPYHHLWSFPGFPAHGHGMLNVVDWLGIDCRVDGQDLYPSAAEAGSYTRRLDLQRGVLHKRYRWRSPSGAAVQVYSERFVSLADRRLAAVRYRLVAESPVSVSIAGGVQTAVVSQSLGADTTAVEQLRLRDDGCDVELRSRTSDQLVALGLRQRCSAGAGRHARRTDGLVQQEWVCELEAGQELVLEKLVAVASSIEQPDDDRLASCAASADTAAAAGFESALAAQVAAWEEQWSRADIRIDGAPLDQQALRFNCFHMIQAHPHDDRRSIGANCLTGDKYRGHVFWDTEMYLLPHFLYTDPVSVRSLLMYRWHLLDRARERAVQMQGVGALYSWNSITGEECGFVFEASTAEYHLQSAIAYGIWRYHEATGDDDFLQNHGVDILVETARFLHDRGCHIPGRGFCINSVCGPDEYACGVDNNCYTNLMAQWHLGWAASVLEEIQRSAPAAWRAVQERLSCDLAEADAWRSAAAAMYIPYDDERRIHAQDDSYLWKDPADMRLVPKNTDIRESLHPLNLWRLQVSKQADVVLAMLVQGWQFDRSQKRRNYEFYEPRTNHGSSLSPCIHSIIANEVGYEEAAYDYFRHSVLMDLADFKDNTSAGVHAACLGGNWLAVVQGFAGMRDWPDRELAFAPRCPAAWTGYRFTIVHRGASITVAVDRTSVTLTLAAEAGPRRIRVHDEAVDLQPGTAVVVPLAAPVQV
ncbi:MAG: glycoside hydrolase family 65 protein, partial [Planctomycetota bacterium]